MRLHRDPRGRCRSASLSSAERSREHGRFLDRPLAEESPEWKQLIPYVVVRDRGNVFLMERTDAGGDPRLHRKATIGVGGHLNPVDEGERPAERSAWSRMGGGARRRLGAGVRLVGFLNDDSNPVGSVHLGVVFEVEADGRPVTVRETHKLTGRFAEPAEVEAAFDRMETWSQLVAAHLLGGPPGDR